MRSSPRDAVRRLALTVALSLLAHPARADVATATATLLAHVQARTVLRLSAPTLQFLVVDPARGPAEAVVEFEAAARTRTGGDVVLTLEPVGPLDGPHGAADVDARVTFLGSGEGTLSGTINGRGTSVVARWTGSGKRRGRLVFALAGIANPGLYVLPVRFVLTAP